MTSDANSPSTDPVSDCTAPNRPFMIGRNEEKASVILFRPRCKQWSCPYCAQVNQNLWAVRAYFGTRFYQEQEQEIDFLTLTPHEGLTPSQTMWVFPKAWKKLSMRARRAASTFSYLMIPEKFQDGRIHVHAIETGALGETWWKKNARSSGLGYIQEEEPIRKPQGAASYVVKYLSKSIAVLDWPAYFRRIRTSRDWPPLPALEPPEGWQFWSLPKTMPISEMVNLYTAKGYEVQILGSAEAWRYIDPETPT